MSDRPHDTQVLRSTTSASAERSVLVVDDDEGLLSALGRTLRRAGYEVTTATSVSAAIEQVLRRHYDVVVTDINMPETSGIELLQVARAYDSDLPIILMTGDPSVDTAIDAVKLGALQYVVKPIEQAELIAALERGVKVRRDAAARRGAMVHPPTETTGDLKGALDRALASMWVAYQPIVDCQRSRVLAYEALMRPKEPSLPHPGAVLEAAERLDRLPELGRQVRRLAAQGFVGARQDALLFVNLHTRDLLDDELFDTATPLGKLAERVVLEITERASLDHVNDVQQRIRRLRDVGFRLAVDDLGAGYAGLSSFVELEPEYVKLDMSLVRGIAESRTRQRVVGTMTKLCTDLDIHVIAEGVETASERDCIRLLGCTLMQGYLFAKPGPPFPTVSL